MVGFTGLLAGRAGGMDERIKFSIGMLMGGLFGGASVLDWCWRGLFVRGMGKQCGMTWYLIVHMWYLKRNHLRSEIGTQG